MEAAARRAATAPPEPRPGQPMEAVKGDRRWGLARLRQRARNRHVYESSQLAWRPRGYHGDSRRHSPGACC
jgi:hypothetical protein